MKLSVAHHLPKLALLDLLVECRSFRAAAARAQVTPSAVSQTVSALETLLSCTLLIRDRAGLRPTEACLDLLQKLKPVLQAVTVLDEQVRAPRSTLPTMTSLHLGSYESLAISVLPALVLRLKDMLPKLRLSVRIGRSGELARLVRKGELSMAITTEIDAREGLSIRPLAEDRFGVFVAATHPLATRGREALDSIWLAALAPGAEGFPRYFARYLRAQKLPKPAVVSDGLETLRAMAAEGAVAAVLPARVAQRVHGRPLTELRLGQASATGTHGIWLIAPRICREDECDFVAEQLRSFFR